MDHEKLSRLHEYITITAVMICGMGLALLMGHLSGGGNVGKVILILALIGVLAMMIKASRKLWLIIPPCWILLGRIPILPLPFTVRDLAVIIVFVAVLICVALRIIRTKPQYDRLDLLLMLNVGYLTTCFFRNPVGVDAFDSELVGGRPYFEVFVAVLAYLVLVRTRTVATEAKWACLLVILACGMVAGLGVVTQLFPMTVPVIGLFYTGIDSSAYDMGDVRRSVGAGAEGQERISGFQDLGKYGSIGLCSFFHPFTLLIPAYPFRFFLAILTAGVLLASGFRSMVLYSGAMFMLGIYFRGGWRSTLSIGAASFLMLILIVGGQGRIYNLPFAMQRALSFLPGQWDSLAKDSGKGSTEWRLEMWKIVLTSDEFIRDKFLGDGFGFTKHELQFINASQFQVQTDSLTREYAMITGDYHSGPISTLKFVGIPGLILFYILIISMARMAVTQINRARGTPFFAFVLFFGMPIVFEPFFYTFIFGGYGGALPTALFSAGMLKMIKSSLDAHFEQNADVAPRKLGMEYRRLSNRPLPRVPTLR